MRVRASTLASSTGSPYAPHCHPALFSDTCVPASRAPPGRALVPWKAVGRQGPPSRYANRSGLGSLVLDHSRTATEDIGQAGLVAGFTAERNPLPRGLEQPTERHLGREAGNRRDFPGKPGSPGFWLSVSAGCSLTSGRPCLGAGPQPPDSQPASSFPLAVGCGGREHTTPPAQTVLKAWASVGPHGHLGWGALRVSA